MKKGGFKAGYKPPAAYFNWFFNRISESVKELQNSLRALAFKDTVSDADITDVTAGKVKQDSTHRMITDTERTNWNDANTKKHTHSNKTVLDKVTQALLDNWSAAFTHVSDAVKHITSAERTKWNAVTDKVDKVSGKQLSTNDYTTAEKNKLAGIAAGAEVNVQPDWNQTDVIADDYIKNRPVSFPPSGHTHDDRYYTETEMNTKLGAKVTASGGDVSDTKVGSITASTASYPVPAAGDTVKVGFGKITKFFGDVKNWMTGVCLIGSIVNNCVTNNAKLPLSAAQGKVLMDLYTVLNTKTEKINISRKITLESVAVQNEGQMRTGLYTVPEDGIYLVYYQQYVNYPYASDIDIVINLSGNGIALSRYHSSNTNYIETMSCMTVIEARQGEVFTFNIKNTNAVSLTSNNDSRISYGLVIRLR